MKLFFTQFIKDFRANFSNFNAYIILGIYYILSIFSAIYLGDYFLRETEIMNSFFAMQPVILTFVIPAITMRSWAEEVKSGTIELLLTQPISYITLVMAKFCAALCFFVLLLSSSLLLFFISNKLSVLDIGIVISGYIGVFLCGTLFIAIGCAISIFNKNNILSYVTTIFVLFTITQLNFTYIGNLSLACLNFENNFSAFLSGILSINNVIYFVITTAIFIWINLLGVYYRKNNSRKDKLAFIGILFVLGGIFFSLQTASFYILDKQFDITDEKRLTLSNKTKELLKNLDKRIELTLYESKVERENANSSFAIFAEFAEKISKIFEKESGGAVRTNIVLVEPFSELERRLVRQGMSFSENRLGYKKYLAFELLDNEGNSFFIKSFNNLRQNLLETDLARAINMFGNERKKLAIYFPHNKEEEITAFQASLDEFYEVTTFKELPPMMDTSFDSLIVLNPYYLSVEEFLSIEQYLLRGKSVLFFGEPSYLSNIRNKSFIDFLKSYGIKLDTNEILKMDMDNEEFLYGPTVVKNNEIFENIRTVLVNEVGKVSYNSTKNYTVKPILEFNNNAVGVVSEGTFVSNYLDLASQYEEILPVSAKSGKLFFFYDFDLLKDYIISSSETKNNYFYEIVTASDNLLFLLRLLDYATNSNYEKGIEYRHFAINYSSIGNSVLKQIKDIYKEKKETLEKKLAEYTKKKEIFYSSLSAKGFATIKNLGDYSEIEQIIDETEDSINKINLSIGNDYKTIISVLTFILILILPMCYILILFLIVNLYKKKTITKIRKEISNA